jgi:hypothetical protein
MCRTVHRRPGFDSLEVKLLLSTGVVDPALMLHREVIKAVRLNLIGT